MEHVKVEICCGTACYLLGAAKLLGLENRIAPAMRKYVEFEANGCLGRCEDDRIGGAPYVRFNGKEFMANATPDTVLARIRELADPNGECVDPIPVGESPFEGMEAY